MIHNGRAYRAHVLVIPYPSQGHINPMYQFCNRLVSKGTKATLAITPYISKSTSLKSDTVAIETISGGYAQASSIEEYLALMEAAGSKTLAELIQKHAKSNNPIDCIVYESMTRDD
ncbi:UDP-glycosyltransferase 74F2 [Forsythia ovata]|uniref:UDP-glycosyltransferase 74F2 n=1 Tax=Forsythia ovata TaxID=205694 RepID=A0ABD1P954_9LAMI